jgi:para-aminobenzoate synthetase component I
MSPLFYELETAHSPESLVERLHGEPGVVLLRSALFESPQARCSFVTTRPFLTFRSFGSRGEITRHGPRSTSLAQFGNPWRLLDSLMSSYELPDEMDVPFPLGGCFGYWGYDLRNFVEPKLPRRAGNDLELPDCQVGFYDSLVVFDHHLGRTWIISTGFDADGSRSERRAREQSEFWQTLLNSEPVRCPALRVSESPELESSSSSKTRESRTRTRTRTRRKEILSEVRGAAPNRGSIVSNFSRADFLACIQRAQAYIHAGDIYQVNLSQRLAAPCDESGWEMFQALSSVSPAPFSAFLDCGDFQIASSSPELFLRLSGLNIQTRPIKGTRPRSADPTRDAQLAYELQTSAKEMSELVMITDLLRNDLGRVCEFGSVRVPELARLERYPHVQHLVSIVEGRLRPEAAHFPAFAACFPGGSITGAPKFRAMEIIDELEPIARGPYTGALGYLGFNRESQLSIIIRAAICTKGTAYFQIGAGIVADSEPVAEYDETLAKAGGFFEALQLLTNPRIFANEK